MSERDESPLPPWLWLELRDGEVVPMVRTAYVNPDGTVVSKSTPMAMLAPAT